MILFVVCWSSYTFLALLYTLAIPKPNDSTPLSELPTFSFSCIPSLIYLLDYFKYLTVNAGEGAISSHVNSSSTKLTLFYTIIWTSQMRLLLLDH